MKPFRIHQGKAIPYPLRIFIAAMAILLTTQALLWLSQPLSLIISIMICGFLPAFWFATNVIIIDKKGKEIFQGIWTMGRRFGKTFDYPSAPSILIEKESIEETLYQLPNNETISVNAEFRAYLPLETGEKLFLISHPLEDRLLEKVTKIKKALDIV